MNKENNKAVQIARLEEKIDAVHTFILNIEKKFVRKEAFEPVRNIVYGTVKVALGTLVTGIVMAGAYFLVFKSFV